MARAGDLERILAELETHRPPSLALVSGAGISVDHPTHAPGGIALMKSAMNRFFEQGTLAEVEAAYESIGKVPGVSPKAFEGRPRLEAVLDVATSVHGAQALETLADSFRGRSPNRLHAMVASLIAAGARSITANFDELIEDAAAIRGLAHHGATHHFHGRIGPRGSGLPFGATLSGIEYGFSPHARRQFLDPLEHPETKVIAYIGYSFSDYFDATPATIDALSAGALSHISMVLWFDFAPKALRATLLNAPTPGLPLVINAFLDAGIRVARLTGFAGDALHLVSSVLGCPQDPTLSKAATCTCGPAPSAAAPLVEPALQARATLTLLARFGLLGRLEDAPRTDSTLGITTADLSHEQFAAYLWKKGRYRQSLSERLAAIAPTDPLRELKASLAKAQVAWIRGAYLSCTWAVRNALARSEAEQPESTLLLEAFERFGRLAVHVRRLPAESRWLLPIVRLACPDYVVRVEAVLAHSAASAAIERHHLIDALRNFMVEVENYLPEEADRRLGVTRESTITWFQETESLGNFADYTRGQANGGRWRYEVPEGQPWQTSMCHIYEAVGNTADVHRLVLQTAERRGPWGLRDALKSALALDVTWWHRLRLLVRWVLAWTGSPRR